MAAARSSAGAPCGMIAAVSLLLVSTAAAGVSYDVTSYGAVGDGSTDDTLSIAKALADASKAKPSVVHFPAGKSFLTGPLNMSSHMTLLVDGTLLAKSGSNTADGIAAWPQIPPLATYGNSRDGPYRRWSIDGPYWYLQYQAFIYAVNATDIRIAGKGTIDGQGAWWWTKWRREVYYGSAGRPNLVQFVGCRRVEVTGVVLRDSPFWCLHPVLCTDVHVHHMSIRSRTFFPSHSPDASADGIDPDSSRNVMIEHNDVSCGEDNIAIKAGVCGLRSPLACNSLPFRDGTYETRNVTVRYNTFRTGTGISVGSESSGGIRDVHVHDNIVGLCDWDECQGRLALKTALSRGGVIANISFVNNTIYNSTGFIRMQTNYQPLDTPPFGYAPTTVANITFAGNRALGGATDALSRRLRSASFTCSVHDVCEHITVVDNYVEHNSDPWPQWYCEFIHTYEVGRNNTGQAALEKCMRESMKPSIALVV